MNIDFICQDQDVVNNWPPKLAKELIPDEFKNLPDSKEKYKISEVPHSNIKICLPAMDYMSSGYVLFNSYELELETIFVNFQEDLRVKTSKTISKNEHESNIHARKALAVYNEESCPVVNENKKAKSYFKTKTSWGIRTPEGYSCLIMQPFYLNEKRYTVLPAIIDTDTYHLPIPLVGYLNVKGPIRIRPGEPILQIFPFKRDDWIMNASTEELPDKSKFYVWNSYKRLFHKIKSFL